MCSSKLHKLSSGTRLDKPNDYYSTRNLPLKMQDTCQKYASIFLQRLFNLFNNFFNEVYVLLMQHNQQNIVIIIHKIY